MLLVPSICNDRHEAMSYSLVEAAIACGVNRSTVLRAIKASKISASKDEQGEWRIEPAEVHRVYPPVQANEARPERAHQETLIAELRNALSGMRRDRDEWRGQARRFSPAPPPARTRPGAAAVSPAPRVGLDGGDRVPCGRGLVARLGDCDRWRSATATAAAATAAAAGMLHG